MSTSPLETIGENYNKPMRKFNLNKLVKDDVFASMQELGQEVTHRVLTDAEMETALKQKLAEEADELAQAQTPESIKKELCDIVDVTRALGSLSTDRSLAPFEQRIFVEQLAVPADDPWADYYAAHPARFPEVL